MKKKIIIGILILVIIIVIVITTMNWIGRKPFAKLATSEVTSAEILLIPPETRIEITDSDNVNELVDILNELVVYREDEAGREYEGQLVQVTFTLNNGETFEVGAFNPFLFVNEKCYRTKYEPCERLSGFGNKMLNDR